MTPGRPAPLSYFGPDTRAISREFLPGGFAAAFLVGNFQLSAALAPASSNLPLILIVGIPSWATAIFTVAMWYRSVLRRRASREPGRVPSPPVFEEDPPG